jgi:hypothetical protein
MSGISPQEKYQVILLENFNEWNVSPGKEGSTKKKRERKKRKREKRNIKKKKEGLKSKRGEYSYEEAPCFKRRKKEDEIYKLLGEISSKERKRRSHFPIVRNLMCGLIHTHTSFAFVLPSIP